MSKKKKDLFPLPATIAEIFPNMPDAMASALRVTIDTTMTQADFDKEIGIMLILSPGLDVNALTDLDNVMWNNLNNIYILVNDTYMYVLPEFQTMPQLAALDYQMFYHGQANTTAIGDYNYPNMTSLTITGGYSIVPDFSKMPKLEKLDLSRNLLLIETVPDFSHIGNLKQLSLSGNELIGAMHDFTHLPQLTSLDLSSNALYELPETPLSNPNCIVNYDYQYFVFSDVIIAKAPSDTLVQLPIYFQLLKYNLMKKSREQIFDSLGNQVGNDVEIQTQEEQVLFKTSQLAVGNYTLTAQINDYSMNSGYVNQYKWNLIVTE